ncbi:2-oxo acid dehydrogenase subunit E2 [Methyloligella sp. 2.7D]|uniref:2-oxo acid dehydrogenase subunit E2 n=1 Tax=unclassified Methyloligella TaxID=2625955 RepID=UPI00157C1101|nr:2-oxo acid dehydrogenase subunit E2 [Methyloligella sp. GL2]QKP77490.1 2-oxo acid dehydrogenase subunit E2 [Methyloligella sp. GL2]
MSTDGRIQGGNKGSNKAGNRIVASPYARRLANERQIPLAALSGSGPHGRIVARDAPEHAEAAAPGPSGISGMTDKEIFALYEPDSYELEPHSTMSRMIAEKLTMAQATVPHFYLSVDCQIDELLKTRKEVNARSPAEGPEKFRVSVNDFLIKAMAMALAKVPEANATWAEAGLLRHVHADIGVAVALEEGGLHTPVVRQAELKGLKEISMEMKDLAHRARSKRLAPHEYQGGVTSISNLGMYGIRRFSAVINPPQSSILAVGRAERRVVPVCNDVATRTVMAVTLSCDHRVIDGALGAKLLGAFKTYVEDPVLMLL